MLTADASHERSSADSEESAPLSADDLHRPPQRTPEALTGQGPLPRVKRFNRKTVAMLVAVVAAVAIAAFGRSFTRPPPVPARDPSVAESPSAPPSAAEAINHLPGSYREAPHLGSPIPGEVGAMMAGAPAAPGSTSAGSDAPGAPVPMTGSRPESERDTLALRVRESGFGFAGGAGVGASEASHALDRLAGAGSLPNAAIGGAPARTDRDADNRQDDKQEFLDRSRGGKWALKEGL